MVAGDEVLGQLQPGQRDARAEAWMAEAACMTVAPEELFSNQAPEQGWDYRAHRELCPQGARRVGIFLNINALWRLLPLTLMFFFFFFLTLIFLNQTFS